MDELWKKHRRTVRLIAGVILSAWTVAAVADADRPVIAVVCALMASVGLAVQPRYPVLVLAGAMAGMVAAAYLGGSDGPDDPFILAITWASYGVGRFESFRRQPWTAAAVLVMLSLNIRAGGLAFPSILVFPVLFTAGPWLAGLWIQLLDERSRAALQVARDVNQVRGQELERATAEERLRLARELHDVAAHHMTTVSLQAQVLQERLQRGEAIPPEAAALIGRSTQAALGEIRRVVGVLRSSGEQAEVSPLPSLADLPALVDAARDSGQDVTLRIIGEARPLAEGLSLTVYRIAQEALSNARRHGNSSTTALTLTWAPAAVTLRVDSGLGSLSRRATTGSGLLGMRERVALYGGQLKAGPRSAGRWTVEATLPVTA